MGLVWPSYRKGPFQLAGSICLFLTFDGGGTFGGARTGEGNEEEEGWKEREEAGGRRLSLASLQLSEVGWRHRHSERA